MSLVNLSESYQQELTINNFSCIWTLKNFSKCGEEALYSPDFSVESDCNIKMNIIAYPKGCSKLTKNYLSVYLNFVSSNKSKVPVKFGFAVLNEEKEETKNIEGQTILAKGMGFQRFVKREYILNQSNKVLPDDNLTIVCKVTILPDSETNRSRVKQIQVPKCSLPVDLRQLYESEKFCDVTLSVSERDILAHKAILAARSSVFAAMFEHEMEEKKQNRVVITDIDQDVLKEMLTFIYTDKVDNLINMASDLLIAANKYDLERLKVMCEEELCKELCVENAADNLILADVHNAKQLKEQTIEFIKQNAKQIIETSAWKTKILEYPQLLAEVFRALVIE